MNNQASALRKLYPQIYSWYKGLQCTTLSATGYKNYAIRFGVTVDELRNLIAEFEKGETRYERIL